MNSEFTPGDWAVYTPPCPIDEVSLPWQPRVGRRFLVVEPATEDGRVGVWDNASRDALWPRADHLTRPSVEHQPEAPITTATEWALLRGADAWAPGTVFEGPVPSTSQPAWNGYLPGITDGMTTVHRTVTYGPWIDQATGQQVDAACSSCGRPAGAGAFAKGRLCNACAVTR